jgi:hypothetical protein
MARLRYFCYAICPIALVFSALGNSCLANSEDPLSDAEAKQMQLTARALTKLTEPSLQERRVSFALSSRSINSILSRFVGMELSDRPTGIKLKLTHIEADFKKRSFPRINADLMISHPLLSTPVSIGVTAALRYEEPKANIDTVTSTSVITVRVQLLGLRSGQEVPAGLENLLSAEAWERLNAKVPPVPLPIPTEFAVRPAEDDRTKLNRALDDLEASLPNGKLHLAITLPSLPELRVKVLPQIVYSDVDGLHVVALVGEGISSALQDSQASAESEAGDHADLLKEYELPAGKDFMIRLSSKPLLEAITRLNGLAVTNRTVKLSCRPEKHILDRTGGAPFGNGFESWFEGTPVGKGIISDAKAEWVPESGVRLSFDLTMDGSAQVHVHGNRPHIPPPKVFGRRIGGGVSVGGGVDTSIGGTLSGDAHSRAMLVFEKETKQFLIKLEDPKEVRFVIHTAGIVGDVINLLNVGLEFPLPVGQLQARYKMGSFDMTLRVPGGNEPTSEAKHVLISMRDYDVAFRTNELEVSGTVTTEGPLPDAASRDREH